MLVGVKGGKDTAEGGGGGGGGVEVQVEVEETGEEGEDKCE